MAAIRNPLTGSGCSALPRKTEPQITGQQLLLPLAPPLTWTSDGPLKLHCPRGSNAPPAAQRYMPLRCQEKGCVFPALPATGKCLHHERQQLEPELYETHQPIAAVVDRGKFGVPDPDFEDTRQQDRRRLATQVQSFLDE